MIPHALNGLAFVERLYCQAEGHLTSEMAKRIKEKPAKGFFVFQTDTVNSAGNGSEIPLRDTRGGLWASFAVAMDTKRTFSYCKQAFALAIQSVLSGNVNHKVMSIKWPDEICCNNKTIGVLRDELHPLNNDVVILSMYLYVNAFPDQIISGMEDSVTTMLAETGNCESIGTILRKICESFYENLLFSVNTLLHRYNEHLYKRGSHAELDGRRGIFEHVDENGAFCLLIGDKCMEFHTGKPTFLPDNQNG